MTYEDKTLLELAAKVYANPNLVYCNAWKGMAEYDRETQYYNWDTYWNPLTGSDNALDLVTAKYQAKIKIREIVPESSKVCYNLLLTFEGRNSKCSRLNKRFGTSCMAQA